MLIVFSPTFQRPVYHGQGFHLKAKSKANAPSVKTEGMPRPGSVKGKAAKSCNPGASIGQGRDLEATSLHIGYLYTQFMVHGRRLHKLDMYTRFLMHYTTEADWVWLALG